LFSIDEIVANATKLNFADPTRYQVIIPEGSTDLTFNCSAVSSPGHNLGFTTDAQYGVGHTRAYANNRSFSDMTLTFYQSQGQMERKFFIDWFEKVYDKTTRRFAYANKYVKDIDIRQYTRDGRLAYQIKITEGWPTNVSPVELSYQNGGQISTFTVSLQILYADEIFPLVGTSSTTPLNIIPTTTV
jgi:hypothetical protein